MSAVTIPAVSQHTVTIIMAHGLGDSGAGWVSLAENWRRQQKFPGVKFIFPNAPSIPITMNNGMSMPAWFDIRRPRIAPKFSDLHIGMEDQAGILKSRDYFHQLIQAEIDAGIPSSSIFLGGFSQGGAMSLFSGITAPTKLGGIFGLSCFLPLHSKLEDFLPAESANQATPIFMGHGDSDPMVRLDWAQSSAEILEKAGWKVDLQIYPGMSHSTTPQEIVAVENYINARLAESTAANQK
ncbi:hypothetical protein BP6252_11113 [Coleophoma cylindrospora]|uniref:Acyl-protein thioesterase 1 n=1 Tax=Coleophoma cylindrospora TaxID=1849047 RepID=A0A3D8QPG2_9HELO|nr:hypothetical protein BP6252_11113 [Coleophoma cylindrospora]